MPAIIDKPISEVMTVPVPVAAKGDTIRAAARVMAGSPAACVVIVEAGRPIGIATERDLVRAIGEGRDLEATAVGEIMTTPVISYPPETTAVDAMEVMRQRAVRRLPVCDASGSLIGIVTQIDLVRAAREGLIEVNRTLSRIGPARIRFVQEFAGSLRAPIVAIEGAVTSLQDGKSPVSPEGRGYVEMVERHVKAMSHVVNDIIDRTEGETTRVETRLRVLNRKEGGIGGLITRNVLSVPPEANARSIDIAMAKKRISCVIVVREERPLGIITETDFVRAAAAGIDVGAKAATDIMTAPVHCVGPDISIVSAVAEMVGRGVRRLPVVDADGKVAGLVTITDVLRASREELVAVNAELRRLAEVRSEFVSEIARALRTPLAVVAGAAAKLDAESGGNAGRYGKIIGRNARRLTRLVERLRTLSGLEKGSIEPRCEAFDAAALLKEYVGAIAPDARRAGVAIRASIPAAGAPAFTDPELLLGAISYCVSNAIRYSPRGGAIAIVLQSAQGRLRVAVTDGGPGIPQDETDLVFEPFYRSENIAASDERGAGLGLALARLTAKVLGGTVQLESRPGKGTRCTIEVPKSPPAARPSAAA